MHIDTRIIPHSTAVNLVTAALPARFRNRGHLYCDALIGISVESGEGDVVYQSNRTHSLSIRSDVVEKAVTFAGRVECDDDIDVAVSLWREMMREHSDA